VRVPLLGYHFRAGLLEWAAQRGQLLVVCHFDSEYAVCYANLAIASQQDVWVRYVPKDLVQVQTLFNKRKHLGGHELVELQVVDSEDQFSEWAPRDESEKLLEKEFVVGVALVIYGVGQLIEGVEALAFGKQVGDEFEVEHCFLGEHAHELLGADAFVASLAPLAEVVDRQDRPELNVA